MCRRDLAEPCVCPIPVEEGTLQGIEGRTADSDFEAWLLRHYDETADPRMERYWRLVSVLKKIEYDPSTAEANRWLVEGMRRRVARRNGEGEPGDT